MSATSVLVLEKYAARMPGAPCSSGGSARSKRRFICVRGWCGGIPFKKAGVPTEYGSGEAGLILAGHAADAAVERGVTVRYRGKWTRRERRGPWSVNKAMRCE